MAEGTKAPWHLWVVGLLGVLWNGFGAYDYTMTQLRNRDYLEAAMEPLGMTVDEAIAYFDAFPALGSALWAVGVWFSLLGSILLLIRLRHAVTAFLVSAIGAVLSFAYQFSMEMPEAIANHPMTKIMPFVIIGVVLLQWWYARKQAANGVLR